MPFLFEETDESYAKMDAFLEEYPKINGSNNIYNALNEERGIQKFAKSVNADIISLSTHGRTGLLKMISPSITESLVNHSEIPVFSININTK